MLLGREFYCGGIFWSCPINQADVFVRFVDVMDVEKARRDERARAGRSRGRTFAEKFHVEAAFLLRFAQRGLLRVFVQFDVPAERQPFVELAMMDEQNRVVVNDKNRDGEINFFVDVGHVLPKKFNNKDAKAQNFDTNFTAKFNFTNR